MKIEQLVAQYFYTTRAVTLQGVGTFTLSSDFVMPAENDKPAEIPADTIAFAYNKKATEDTGLIDYIVQQTRKIKPLASSDLESYVVLGSQFLNIGKPFKIDGIGVLEKNQVGEYEFTPYTHFINAKAEDAPTQLKEKKDDKISFAQEAKTNGAGKKIMAALAAVIVLGGIGWGAWYLLNKKKETIPETVTQNTSVPLTTPAADTAKKDTAGTLLQKPDSIAAAATTQLQTPGMYNFKVVIKNYPSLIIAQKRFDKLSSYGHKLILYTNDSVTYKVAMPLNLPLSDTTYALDSLRKKLFGGNPYIELK